MRVVSIIGLIAGLAVMTWLIAWQGVSDIAALLRASGWPLLLVPLIWLPTLFMTTRSWQVLFAPDRAPRFWPTFMAQWMGRAVNTLLPVATIGGEIVKARVLILWGVDAKDASAATLVDKAIQVVTIILWGLIGLALLAATTADDTLLVSGLIGMAILTAGAAGFIVVQRAGIVRFVIGSAHKVTNLDLFGDLVGAAGTIDGLIVDTYRRYGRLLAATAWRLASLILQSGEVWLAALLLGYPISIVEALLVKSLTSTLSDVAFVVPNSYGVQEGAFVVLGALVGWAPDVALAVSLVVRIRELIIDVPGLIWWQHAEGHALFKRRRKTGPRSAGPN